MGKREITPHDFSYPAGSSGFRCASFRSYHLSARQESKIGASQITRDSGYVKTYYR